MRAKRRTAVILLAFGLVLVTWRQALSDHRPGVLVTPNQGATSDRVLILPGTLDPRSATPIHARNLELVIPVNAWVLKGQIIGEADGPSPEGINQARISLEEANAVVAVARRAVRDMERKLEMARADAGVLESRLISAETVALEAESEFRRRDLLFREQRAGSIEHDEAIATRDSALSAVPELRSRLIAGSTTIGELETVVREARDRLAEAETRSRAAQANGRQMEENGGRVPVVSPADGVLVVRDAVAGAFGIASDASLLCVHTDIRQADLNVLWLGQRASVSLDDEPAVVFNAQVSEIAETAIDSPRGALYPVSLSVENPDGKRFFGGERVQIRLRVPVDRSK